MMVSLIDRHGGVIKEGEKEGGKTDRAPRWEVRGKCGAGNDDVRMGFSNYGFLGFCL